MIYEMAVVAKAEFSDAQVTALNGMVRDVVKAHDGDVYIEDDWGVLNFAAPTQDGAKRGRYLYFCYRANSSCNAELNRRLGINENIIKQLVIQLGSEQNVDKIIKAYRTPFSKKYHGSVLDTKKDAGEDADYDMEKDRRNFSRRKTCWFTAKKIRADWKDPATYSWLINEFGKITPARISGISAKHQRWATQTIKRARQLGLCSYLSGRIAQ